ncbi:hypothetical protein K504DRAFT_457088 [Pleomassaria siparia CBS 279.74]|uniref:Uncharacterized protein n=1 Tax=Pleomassaria siparia CBS 279.74 TaxID=1314801 RepID=A0A6G1KR00_9PLEO|nr:hypothetical protein K504DRAFT_457088 [Pleomassaria siparia CBS 279.74]
MFTLGHNVILPDHVQAFIGLLILVLFLVFGAIVFLGFMILRLIELIQTLNETFIVGDSVKLRRVERKKES